MCTGMNRIRASFALFVAIMLPSVVRMQGDELPAILGGLIEERRHAAMRAVEREFKEEVKDDTEGFQKLVLAINRGVFAKGTLTAAAIEKMLGRELEVAPEGRFDKKNIRCISWDTEFEDFSDYEDRRERVLRTATWRSYFEFDASGKLVRVWLE